MRPCSLIDGWVPTFRSISLAELWTRRIPQKRWLFMYQTTRRHTQEERDLNSVRSTRSNWHFCHIHFNIILPSAVVCLKWTRPFTSNTTLVSSIHAICAVHHSIIYVKLSLCLTSPHEYVWRNGGIRPRVLYFSTICR